jgi:manganese/zinc/iron transport system ATP- binding protein
VSASGKEPAPLEIHDLTVGYQSRSVLWGVDVTLKPGELVGLIGPNGAGKSTLIKACMGILPATSGWIRIFGEPNERALHRVGYVPQRESVDWDFPVSVEDVVAMGRYGKRGLFRGLSKEDRKRISTSLDRVGMLPFSKRQIGNLSGGQQQRVFLARALAQDADLYFMDEPFVGVDAATEAALVEVLRELRSSGRTILVVHHDLPTARTYFDSLLLLNLRVVAYGPTETVFTPELLQKTYGGRLNILAEVASHVGKRPRPEG